MGWPDWAGAMQLNDPKLTRLRQIITENLRVQRGGSEDLPYIDVSNAMVDVCSRQNHTIFARRGCGKTLLLHDSTRRLDTSIKSVYLNCEDFKRHSFPNVLIEILDALFGELEKHLTGWFGKKKRSRTLIQEIRRQLNEKGSS
jgi:predicted AAA+ superfamily ATPase